MLVDCCARCKNKMLKDKVYLQNRLSHRHRLIEMKPRANIQKMARSCQSGSSLDFGILSDFNRADAGAKSTFSVSNRVLAIAGNKAKRTHCVNIAVFNWCDQSWNEDRTYRDRDETLKLRDTRLHKPKIRKYKNDSNTLEYGLY